MVQLNSSGGTFGNTNTASHAFGFLGALLLDLSARIANVHDNEIAVHIPDAQALGAGSVELSRGAVAQHEHRIDRRRP